jgi:predicted secreted protein
MNTLLLPTNTTNCTTKNFKLLAAVICLTAVFVFTNLSAFAQSFSNSQGATQNQSVKKEITVQKSTNADSKSIEQRRADKEAWLKDHPDGIETAAPVEKTKTEGVVSEKNIQPTKAETKVHSPEVVKKETPAPVHIVTEYKGTPQRLNGADIKVTPVTE